MGPVCNEAQFLWKTLGLCFLPAGRHDSCYNTCGAPVLHFPQWHITRLDAMIQHTCEHCTVTSAYTNKDATA